MDLKKYAYDMWALSREDVRRGNPDGIEMGFELFRRGCLTGREPLEGFVTGVDWAQAQAEWNASADTREASIAELRAQEAAFGEELRAAFDAGDREGFDAIMAWPRHSAE